MIRKYVSEGALMPRGYGLAWYDVMRRRGVCYPIPFNLLANGLRKLYYAVAGPSIPEFEKKLANEYTRGVQAGWAAHKKKMEHFVDEELEHLKAKSNRRT